VQAREELDIPTQVLPCDLGNEAEIDDLLSKNEKSLSQVNVVFLNAGISQRSLARETEMHVYRKVMDVNYYGSIHLAQFLRPFFVKNSGKMVVVSSVAGKFGVAYRSAYSASKHALHGYFEALRVEENIEISMVCPGFIKTDISKHAMIGNGSTYGGMDDAQANGMPVDLAVSKMLNGVSKGKKEIYVGGFKETKFAVFMHNNFPNLFYKILRKTRVR